VAFDGRRFAVGSGVEVTPPTPTLAKDSIPRGVQGTP
jgi:hypothetical protein